MTEDQIKKLCQSMKPELIRGVSDDEMKQLAESAVDLLQNFLVNQQRIADALDHIAYNKV